MFDLLEAVDCPRCVLISDPTCGLRAILVIDDVTLGPAAGGIRTRRYASIEDAFFDAARLARAMTIKCALGRLESGGGKLEPIQSAPAFTLPPLPAGLPRVNSSQFEISSASASVSQKKEQAQLD